MFIVACAELVGGDDAHDCRARAPAAAAPKVVPAPIAPEPADCDDGESPPEPWDGTGRSEAVRGA